MAQPELVAPPTLRVAVQKPKFGIYYVLLIIALCAMIVSCAILYTFIRGFGGFGAVPGKVSATQWSEDLFNHKGHEGRQGMVC